MGQRHKLLILNKGMGEKGELENGKCLISCISFFFFLRKWKKKLMQTYYPLQIGDTVL